MVEVSNIKSIFENKLYQKDLQISIDHVIGFEKLKNKKILITGANGLIGSYLVDVLHRSNKEFNMGIAIYALGRNLERLKKRFPYGLVNEDITFVEHDVIIPFNEQEEKYVDYVIHAASNSYPKVIYGDPVGTIQANIIGTINLLQYMKNLRGTRFLFVSSGEIYGQADKDVLSFSESYTGKIDILSARSCYPLSKRCAENLCVSYSQQFGVNTVIVRPCHTYGPNVTEMDNRANTQFIERALKQENIILKSKGSQIRSYSYIGDTASGLLTVLINGIGNEAYNLSSTYSTVSIAGFAEKVAELTGVKVIYTYDDTQPTPFDRAVLNNEKLKRLGWTSAFGLDEGIRHTLLISRRLKC